jgi:iron complex outermembrane receptor protein
MNALLLLLAVVLQPAPVQVILVQNAGVPVAGAQAMAGGAVVAVSNGKGELVLPDSVFHLEIGARGYQTVHVSRPFPTVMELELQMRVHGESIVVVGSRDDAASDEHAAHALEHNLAAEPGMDLVKRGAFGVDIALRGLDDQRTEVRVNGMAVFKACVDKMDPVTSYVESSNLKAVEAIKGGGSVAKLGGKEAAVDLRTQTPKTGEQSVESSVGVRSPDYYRYFFAAGNHGSGRRSLRWTMNTREAENYQTGGHKTTIQNSGYSKINGSLHGQQLLKNGRTLTAFLLVDDARDAGYPALLMDARRATALMAQVELEWAAEMGNGSASVYTNRIRHAMDDFDRDVTTRAVMPGMYMPMLGKTSTSGIRIQQKYTRSSMNWRVGLDAYHTKAYGDMEMIPVVPEVPVMFLYNLENIVTTHAQPWISFSMLMAGRISVTVEGAVTTQRVTPQDRASASYFEGLHGAAFSPQWRMFPAAGVQTGIFLSERVTWSNSVRVLKRGATFQEQFGHYIYNYVDGFFYEGNPWLKPERSTHFESSLAYETSAIKVKIAVYSKKLSDYIAGRELPETSSVFYRFRTYTNIGTVRFDGLEAGLNRRFGEDWRVDASLSYTRATWLEAGDPLPFIAPLRSGVKIGKTGKTVSGMLEFQYSAAQNRVSGVLMEEGKTASFYVVNGSAAWNTPLRGTSVSVEVLNAANRAVVRHTSINNLPDPGRTVMISLKHRFSKKTAPV